MRQEETLLRRCLRDAVPLLETKNITTTMIRAAMAGICRRVIDLVPIVVGEFLACLDILARYNPDRVAKLFHLAVGITRMIDIACGVLGRIPIKGIALIQSKDIDIACG